MGKRAIRHYIFNVPYAPAAVGSAETVAILAVQPGWRVVSASARKKVLAAASTNTTVALGDGTSVSGFIAAIDTETGAAGDLIDGQGALFNQGSKLYTVADTIDANYVNGGTPGAVNPVFEFRIVIRVEW